MVCPAVISTVISEGTPANTGAVSSETIISCVALL